MMHTKISEKRYVACFTELGLLNIHFEGKKRWQPQALRVGFGGGKPFFFLLLYVFANEST